jgi:very-short-patch-repair endonuclease
MRGADDETTERARALRLNSTRAELRLWNGLRARALNGHKFVRQQSIGPYYADFVCRDRQLIVEVDGGQHSENLRDEARGAWLSRHGYRVLQFWNHDVLQNTDGVLQTILSALEDAPPHPDR